MRYLLLGVFAAVLAGCSSPTNPVLTTEQAVFFYPFQPDLVHLEAGGLAIRSPGDTAVNFDLVPNDSVYNDSNVALHLLAKWFLAGDSTEIKPNEQTTVGYPIIDSGTIDLGVVPADASMALDSIPVASLSDSVGWRLNYSVQFQLQGGPLLMRNYHTSGFPDSIGSISNPLIFYGNNLSVPFASRWRGIIYTTEASPDSIAVFDGPDDGDWQSDSLFSVRPAFPNPATGATTLRFSTAQGLDSVRADLYITPHHILRSFSIASVQPGTYEADLNLAGISPGLYRVIWTAYKGDTVASSHGDIMVPF